MFMNSALPTNQALPTRRPLDGLPGSFLNEALQKSQYHQSGGGEQVAIKYWHSQGHFVCMNVHACACVFTCDYVHTHTPAFGLVCAHMYMMFMCVHVHICLCGCVCVCVCRCMTE